MGVNETETAVHIPVQRGEQLLDSAVRYTEERHWDVVPGTWLEAVDGGERCSCGAPRCPAPGAHPVRPDWSAQATGSGVGARRMWTKQPGASILLPTGRAFDAIEVSESAGFLALARMERMELPLGPAACAPDRRMYFFVLPGAAAKVPDLIRALGWSPASLDLATLGEGRYVAAPPTRVGGRGAVQWARHPSATNRWLPEAEELVSALAYACGREAADARGRKA
ncbi:MULTISPECIES: bifunctional DNA primase/polymerase [unclassified Streptomyces]|uniref:bifunctional DNA primase/polymerase n=1 Tax=unclassified Streptomyces TaxID=2593676 RepID=UPI001660F6FC|nr:MULTISPECIES: bifunctional DNA primase/polymerase [unclassified Streptomyces]